jgi:hypothetical protein
MTERRERGDKKGAFGPLYNLYKRKSGELNYQWQPLQRGKGIAK